MKRISLLILLVGMSQVAHATCWESAGNDYGIDPLLLKAIAWKETRGWSQAVGPRLADGNVAVSLMQINTIHLPMLKRKGIALHDLMNDPCTSIKVGASVLAECINKFGNTWKAVGCYNTGPASTNIPAQMRYVSDVKRYYEAYARQSISAGKAQ